MSLTPPATILIALGGNALISHNQRGTYEEQLETVTATAKVIVDLIEQGYEIVLTHGNGPQVGNLLLQHAAAADQVPALPMDVCGAQSQGQIGYLFAQQLRNELLSRNNATEVTALVTQVVVDQADPAFKNPSKPVGPFYSKSEVEQLKKKGFVYKEDAGRGFRRVVPSPEPKAVVEFAAIKTLSKDQIVIATGGGGVPVIETDKGYQGVEAVIDKDKASALLASKLNVDAFVISTGVSQVALDFNTPQQKNLAELKIEDAQRYIVEGHFAPGSMLPKIEAAVQFASETGKVALITDPNNLAAALAGSTGTWVRKYFL